MTMFDEAMTTLAFRINEGMKQEVNVAQYLTNRRESRFSAGAVARAFIASGLREMGAISRALDKRDTKARRRDEQRSPDHAFL